MQMHSHGFPDISVEEEDQQVNQVTTTTEPDPEQLLPDMQTLQKEDPDISMVLRAMDMQKAQSLETCRLLQLCKQLEIRDGILFVDGRTTMALKVCIN